MLKKAGLNRSYGGIRMSLNLSLQLQLCVILLKDIIKILKWIFFVFITRLILVLDEFTEKKANQAYLPHKKPIGQPTSVQGDVLYLAVYVFLVTSSLSK